MAKHCPTCKCYQAVPEDCGICLVCLTPFPEDAKREEVVPQDDAE